MFKGGSLVYDQVFINMQLNNVTTFHNAIDTLIMIFKTLSVCHLQVKLICLFGAESLIEALFSFCCMSVSSTSSCLAVSAWN